MIRTISQQIQIKTDYNEYKNEIEKITDKNILFPQYKNQKILIATINKKIIGFLLYQKNNTQKNNIQITNCIILKEYKNQHIEFILTNYLKRKYKTQNIQNKIKE